MSKKVEVEEGGVRGSSRETQDSSSRPKTKSMAERARSNLSRGGYLSRPTTVQTPADKTFEAIVTAKATGFHMITGEGAELPGELLPVEKDNFRSELSRAAAAPDGDMENAFEEAHTQQQRDPTPPPPPRDDRYLATCRKVKVSPIRQLAESLVTGHVTLKHRGLSVKDTLSLSYALLSNSNVTSLELSDNHIGDEGAKYLTSMLSENSLITHLSLSENQMGRVTAQPLVTAILETSAVTWLDLSGNLFDDAQAHVFSSLIMNTQCLRYLNLSHNSFSDGSAFSIGLAISTNETITELDLSWNKFRPPGSAAILRGVAENKTLRKFAFAMNGVNVQGGRAAAEVLGNNTTLLELDLRAGRMHDDTAVVLAKAMQKNNTLVSLYVGQNYFTSLAITAVLEVLNRYECMTNLKVLHFGDTAILETVMLLAEEVKNERRGLQLTIGPVVKSDFELTPEIQNELTNKNPLVILKWFASSRRLRLVELFRLIDRDGNGLLERHEFVRAIEIFEIPLTEAQLDKLLIELDLDGDGNIDYKEFLEGDKELRRKMRVQKEHKPVEVEETKERHKRAQESEHKFKIDMTQSLEVKEKILNSTGGKAPQMLGVVKEATAAAKGGGSS